MATRLGAAMCMALALAANGLPHTTTDPFGAKALDVVEEHEVAIDQEHEAAVEDLDRVIEQKASSSNIPETQSGIAARKEVEQHTKSESQQRVEALEVALAAADKQNKALEASLSAAHQENKAFEASEGADEAPEVQPVFLRARRRPDPNELSSSSEDTEEPSSNSSEVEVEETAMEKTLTDLMIGSKIKGSPFGSSVKHIAKLIGKSMMPKVLKAHEANQKHLDTLGKELGDCGRSKDASFANAGKSKALYLKMSPMHKTCRSSEAAKAQEKAECVDDKKDKKRIKDLKCREFGMQAKKYGDQQANRQIVKKGGSESTDSYITRITATICGKYPPGGLGGGGRNGFLDIYLRSKGECVKAAQEYSALVTRCSIVAKDYKAKKSECDSIQDQMDGASCKRATEVKDACESYAGCYGSKKMSMTAAIKMVKNEEKDRKAEWRGLKRMQCLIRAFIDGEVYKSEVRRCKRRKYDTDHLTIEYPKVAEMASCSIPQLYPTTAAYKLAEFAPLPVMAKGKKDAFECSGVVEVHTTPREGSPKTCKCERVTLNGPYSAGPLVKCTNCLDARRSLEKNSCPDGTKLFSPRSARDWSTVLSSVGALQEPYFIVDVTRPQNGCKNCTAKAMHSGPGGQPNQWHTADGSPWWLRDKPYSEPNGNYHANCYLAMMKPSDANNLKFDDSNCKFHAKSYYCQRETVDTTPKKGSPPACKCEAVVLTGPYSAGALIKCTDCLPVRKSTQKNSCPLGTKLFSPGSSSDWKTFLNSARPLRSPNFIIDITRPQNGCGGCTRNSMNFGEPAQRTWRTADGSPWWLRSTKYSEPNGDYSANCYMDLAQTPLNENYVTFNDQKCSYYSNAYYCQPVKRRKQKK